MASDTFSWTRLQPCCSPVTAPFSWVVCFLILSFESSLCNLHPSFVGGCLTVLLSQSVTCCSDFLIVSFREQRVPFRWSPACWFPLSSVLLSVLCAGLFVGHKVVQTRGRTDTSRADMRLYGHEVVRTRGRVDTSRADTRSYGPPRFLLRIVHTSRGVTHREFPAWGVVPFCFLSARDDQMSSTTFWKHVLSPPKCVSTLPKVPVSQVGIGAQGQGGWGSRDGHVKAQLYVPFLGQQKVV